MELWIMEPILAKITALHVEILLCPSVRFPLTFGAQDDQNDIGAHLKL